MPNPRCSTLAALPLFLTLALHPVAALAANFGNLVWHDVNGNGDQEGGEPGVAGVTVDLVTADRRVRIDSTTTDANGLYTLVGPVPGAYRIRVHVPDGYEITRQNEGASDTVDSDVAAYGPEYRDSDPIVAGLGLLSMTSLDVGLVQPTTTENVGNFVWLDADGDGVQDGGEAGLAGVQVELWNARKTERLATTTTNLLGVYSFAAPYPAQVRIRVIPPAGHQFSRNDATDDDLDSDVYGFGVDYGFSDVFAVSCCFSPVLQQHDVGLILPVNPATIGNFVWNDDDGNGLQDPGELGIAGVTVQLWDAAKLTLLDTDVTDGSGSYTVSAQSPGGFRIRVIPPPGYVHTLTDAGVDDLDDSDVDSTTSSAGFSAPFWLAASTSSTTTRDAGLVDASVTSTVGNYAWFDADFDGVQDVGEASVAGARVEVWDAPRTRLVDAAVTDANGAYSLTVPRPGQYRIHVPLVRADGLQFTQKNAATTSTDSDIHPWGPDHGFSDPFTISSIAATTSTRDVGLLAQVVPEPSGALSGGTALLAVAIVARRLGSQRGVK